jgi:predicted nicotinamide N-methyase
VSYEVDTVSYRVGDHDYRLRTLRDRQQFSDPEGVAERAGVAPASWPLFGIVWPSGHALAEAMSTFPVEGKRILEVGCGIGLSSLVLWRRKADITASDYQPLAEEFLQFNAALNDLPPLPFHVADWGRPHPALGRFDLIIGADILYERGQPALLAGFLERHAQPRCEVVIADPGRRQWSEFSRLMAAQGYTVTETRVVLDKDSSPGEGVPRGRLALFSR